MMVQNSVFGSFLVRPFSTDQIQLGQIFNYELRTLRSNGSFWSMVKGLQPGTKGTVDDIFHVYLFKNLLWVWFHREERAVFFLLYMYWILVTTGHLNHFVFTKEFATVNESIERLVEHEEKCNRIAGKKCKAHYTWCRRSQLNDHVKG